ncbi:unnamed protein product [Rotaria socialis]|uniref:F-box domain-containing protein n=1 Tax=Rotaria socialis TaxID=392032 RepID=A0A821TB77_9BILA|nr:unnamed protein product [Rotaria socialis]CAF3357477.1 unnamed protein product [Rotaria socialis]CAF3372260.1 unnamed protein product [Rotaria socialis]CAF4277069.1 unnamed protein product [Rotaria socialis]CAF4424364.1 unnamed protein product [Rotaria socialis]
MRPDALSAIIHKRSETRYDSKKSYMDMDEREGWEERMIDSKFELLPVDILFGIVAYLSPAEILQSFLSLNKRFSRIIRHQYVWHICIYGNSMSLSMFNNFCQNMLKLIGRRLVSLRITLNNAIGGWSLVSSSLQSNQTTLLRHLHLINIEPFEFDKLLFLLHCFRFMFETNHIVKITNERNECYHRKFRQHFSLK